MKRIFTFIKAHKILTAIAIIIIAGIGFFSLRPEAEPTREVITASKKNITQEVEITGRVEPAEKVDLAVETGGKVRSINYKVGNKVTAGDTILQVDSGELSIRLSKSQSALERAKLSLTKLEKPASTLAQTQAENDLETALETQRIATDDLQEAYESGFNSVTDAFLDIPSALTDLEDVLGRNYLSQNFVRAVYGDTADDYREQANDLQAEAESAYQDVESDYRTITRDSDPATIETLIEDTYQAVKLLSDAIKATNNFIDYVENNADTPPAGLAADQAIIDNVTGEVNVHNVALLNTRTLIKSSKDAISSANREVDEKKAAVLDVFEGAESEDLESARLLVREAELDVQEIELQLSDRTIRSPITGTITQIDAKVGQVIAAGNPVVSVISTNDFQITANLPEADLFKIEQGSPATTTLDAYGSDKKFKAIVSAVNPAESFIEGVATYEITLQFIDADEGIRSGMTADIKVEGDKKENVLSVPQRSVITKSTGKYIRVLENGVEVEKQVTTGLRGTDGNIEITSGLNEGEQVVVFSEAK